MFPMFHIPDAWMPSIQGSRSHLNTLILHLPLVQPFTSRLADILTMGFAWSRQVVPYVRCNKPPPTIFEVRCHPRADAVCAELDSFFMKHWPFKSQKERNRFFTSQTNRWACLAFPTADDDRLLDTIKVNTLLFLLDGKPARGEPLRVTEISCIFEQTWQRTWISKRASSSTRD